MEHDEIKLVEIKNLRVDYPDGNSVSFADMDFYSGKKYLVKGGNGSGKSTLLKAVLSLVGTKNKSVRICLARTEYSAFLDKERLLDFLTPKEYFVIVAENYGLKKDDYVQKIKMLCSWFGKPYFSEDRLIKNHSDGNRQLIGIFASLIVNPRLLILDEPLNFLDGPAQDRLMSYLDEWQKKNKSCLIVASNSGHKNFKSYKTIIL